MYKAKTFSITIAGIVIIYYQLSRLLEVKAPACNAGDLGLIPVSGRSPGEGNGNPLQYSCLENRMNQGAWWATVHGVAKSWTRLSDFTSLHKGSYKVKESQSEVAQLCRTLCNPMDCNLPLLRLSMVFSRQIYWSGLPFPFTEGSSRPKDQIWVSRIEGRCFYHLSHQGSPLIKLW